MFQVYIAGKYTARERLKAERETLRASGVEVTSSWMDNHYPVEADVSDETARREARMDFREVEACDLLILDTLDESNTGGRDVELGMALIAGKQIVRIGPARNVFHKLLSNFESWSEYHAAIASAAR